MKSTSRETKWWMEPTIFWSGGRHSNTPTPTRSLRQYGNVEGLSIVFKKKPNDMDHLFFIIFAISCLGSIWRSQVASVKKNFRHLQSSSFNWPGLWVYLVKHFKFNICFLCTEYISPNRTSSNMSNYRNGDRESPRYPRPLSTCRTTSTRRSPK
jgi:hypothetical protein